MKVCNKCGQAGKRYNTVFDKRRGTSREERICTDCKYEMTRRWKAKNRDKVNAQNKKWVQSHKEKYNESLRKTYHKYHDRNKKRILAYYYKLKERFGMSPATVYRNGGIEIVRAVFKKYNNKCSNCGTENKIHIHHIDNQGRHNSNKGVKPNNSLNNLILLCVRCHAIRHQEEKQYAIKN